MQRPVTRRYEDPLARIWILCAERIGFRIVRTSEAYASTDGRGTILIGEDSQLDADDSLAQMILHELCHALVEGDEGQRQTDWGLGYYTGANPWREQACLRLQAFVAGRFGLRQFLAPTTDFRESFWNQLPDDPFQAAPEHGGRREKSCIAARIGWQRALKPAWRDPMDTALAATARMAVLVRDGQSHSRHAGDEPLPSLWNVVQNQPPPHPGGLAPEWPESTGITCGTCAWFQAGRGRYRRCRRPQARPVTDTGIACMLYEPAAELDCLTCGACCREAYDAVEVTGREAVVKLHPDLIVRGDTRLKLRREGSRCAALQGGHTATEPYACTIYPDRPKTCHEFTQGSAHCLEARQRVGLSL